jgi:hypothetical protein
MKLRAAQRHFLRLIDQYRLLGFLARRQYGKTTTFAAIALKKMMKRKNHTVIFGSAKLGLSREIVRKEAAILQSALAEARLQVADAISGAVPDRLTPDDFAGLFEASRLEFRFFHSRSSYSRTKVVALRPDTVGETGDLMCDEIGSVKNWREVWEAVEPIASSDPTFNLLLSTTPPMDDTHYSYEMLCPPPGTPFPINPEGNLYRSEWGLDVLRVDANDAYADGVPLYDLRTGEEVSPLEHRRRAQNKDAEDRNYFLRFIVGGSAACDLMRLTTAQERGVGQCHAKQIEDDADFGDWLRWLKAKVSPLDRIGVGFDVATTTAETSNPSVFAVMEDHAGAEKVYRACAAWKTRDPQIARERIRAALKVLCDRPGGRPRALAVDATNEKYFAEDLRRELRALLPVILVVASEAVEKPGLEAPTNFKEFLGSQYVDCLDDNHLTLPPESWFRADHRLVMKDRGRFVCEPDADGHHGDTFDAGKLALHALTGISGAVRDPSAIRTGPFNADYQFRARAMAPRA